MPASELTFGRARHVLSRAEWDYWETRPDGGGPTGADVAALAARVELVDGETTLVPGITIMPTPGHTPGHCSFLVSSGTERAVVLGDAIHCPLQISHPEWAFAADANPKAAKRHASSWCASWTRPTRSWSARTSPTRCSAASSPEPCPARSRSTSRRPSRRNRSCRTRPAGSVVLPPLT